MRRQVGQDLIEANLLEVDAQPTTRLDLEEQVGEPE